MREQLVAYFESHRKLVESSALNLILSSPRPLDLSRQLIEAAGPDAPFVTLELVEGMLRHRPAAVRPIEVPTLAPALLPELPDFSLVADGYQVGAPGRGPLQAYGELFASRYRSLSRLLRNRPELSGVRPIRELARAEGKASVIGMIREVRTTSEKHHLILTVEDETGSTDCLVPRDSEGARSTYLVDEVIGLVLVLSRERDRLPRVLSIHRPDVPLGRASKRAPRVDRVMFLSDLHIGSKSFLTHEWGALVDFLHGRGADPAFASEIRHIVIAGDLVDGIGIYPNQERDLAIGDVFEQYAELGRRLREIPTRLNVVVIPGNHDAVCPAEPQPALPSQVRQFFPDNVHAVGNPSTFALDGVVVEAYHGRSFDDLIPAIPERATPGPRRS